MRIISDERASFLVHAFSLTQPSTEVWQMAPAAVKEHYFL